MSGEERNRRDDKGEPGWAGDAEHRSLTVRKTRAPAETSAGVPATFTPAAAYQSAPEDDASLNLAKYLWLVFKHRWLIGTSVAACLAIGLVSTLLQTPVYRASATIQINRDAERILDIEGVEGADQIGAGEFYQTQYEILQSRSLAERVVRDLSLHENAGFMSADVVPPWTRLKQLIFGAPDRSSPDVAAAQRQATGRVMSGLTVAPIRRSSVVRLSFSSPDRQVAALVANGIAEAYITGNLDRRFEASTYARTFLEERLEQIRTRLEESEAELVAYAERERIVSANGQQTLAEANLATANADLTDTSTRRLRAELLWQQITETEGLGLPRFLENDAIAGLRTRRAALSTEYQDKLAFFKPAFPDMLQLQSQINEIDRQIAAEVQLIRDSVKAEYEALVSEETSLRALVEDLKVQINDFRNRNIQYTILQREVDTNRSLYDGLLQRYKEIGVAGGVGTNNVSIIDRAEPPGSAYEPSLSRNLALSLAIGLFLGGGGAFLREHFDNRFKSPEDIEQELGLPLLGILPTAKLDSDENALKDPKSALSEAFRSLRTAIQFSTTEGVPGSLLVTSTKPSEGKSTTAATLARNFAELGLRVLLIDADLRRPSLHRVLDRENDKGLTDCLAGGVSPPKVFQDSGTEGLTFLASGTLPPNPAELLAGTKMMTLLTIATEKFDLVIVDGPPVAGLADAPMLSSMTVGTLLVVDATSTRTGMAKAALKRLYLARAQVIGAVINKLDRTSHRYGYGYGQGYDYDYVYGEAGYYGEEANTRLTDQSEKRGRRGT